MSNDRATETTANLLSMERVNTLLHPLTVRFCGDTWTWPVESIDVETGLTRFDVCGRLQVKRFGEVAELIDAIGQRHDADLFYSDEVTA